MGFGRAQEGGLGGKRGWWRDPAPSGNRAGQRSQPGVESFSASRRRYDKPALARDWCLSTSPTATGFGLSALAIASTHTTATMRTNVCARGPGSPRLALRPLGNALWPCRRGFLHGSSVSREAVAARGTRVRVEHEAGERCEGARAEAAILWAARAKSCVVRVLIVAAWRMLCVSALADTLRMHGENNSPSWGECDEDRSKKLRVRTGGHRVRKNG